MKSEWQTVRTADFMDFNPRLSIKKGTVATKISMDKLRPFTKAVPSVEQAEFSSGTKFANGDTIMARITPCLENGKTAFVDCLRENEIAFGSTEFIVLRAKPGVSDPQFVYYLATSPEFRNVAIKSMVGSSGRQRVQQPVLENLELTVPKLPEQEKIGRFLAELDDKIALNERVNDNLQEQAAALYKSWFVDFAPFASGEMIDSEIGKIPYGWRVYRLSEFLPVITGKKNANVSSDKGEYPFFSCSQDFSWTDNYSFDGHAILVAGNGDFNVKWYKGKFEAYQRTYVLIPHEERYTSWLYYAVKYNLAKITSAARGSVIKFITKGNLENFAFAAPCDLSSVEIIDTFASINHTIDTITQENYRLTEIRDTLLPRLMSGEVDVSDIEI